MTVFDIENIVDEIDIAWLRESIDELSMRDVVAVYQALTYAVDVCRKCENYPSVIYTLSELKCVFALEVANRYLSKIDEDI